MLARCFRTTQPLKQKTFFPSSSPTPWFFFPSSSARSFATSTSASPPSSSAEHHGSSGSGEEKLGWKGRSFEALLFGAAIGLLVGGGVAYYRREFPFDSNYIPAPPIPNSPNFVTAASPPTLPGGELKLDSQILCVGENILQDLTPVRQIHQTVCGLHFYDGEPNRQIIAHHYCSHVSEDFRQCVIYDTTEKNARLIGVEYIISRKMFEELPEEEKKYWHSHGYEICSGVLVAPGVPEVAERQEMNKLVDTYGKTWHTWQIDAGHRLPYGAPKLMLSLTKEGQARRDLVEEKDRRTRISTQERRARRQNIPSPVVARGADQGFYPRENRA